MADQRKGIYADTLRSSGFGLRGVVKAGKHEGVTRRPAEVGIEWEPAERKSPEDLRRESKERERREAEAERARRDKVAGIARSTAEGE